MRKGKENKTNVEAVCDKLWKAADAGNTAGIRQIVDQNSTIAHDVLENWPRRYSETTPLNTALMQGNGETARTLLELGANPDDFVDNDSPMLPIHALFDPHTSGAWSF